MKLIKINIGYVIVENRLPNIGDMFVDHLNKNVRTWQLDVSPEELPYCDVITHSTVALEDGVVIDSQNGEGTYIGVGFDKIKQFDYEDNCNHRVKNGIKFSDNELEVIVTDIVFKTMIEPLNI